MDENYTKSEHQKQWFTAVLEEYKACRKENLQAENNAHSLIKIGFIGLSVLIGSAVNLWNNDIYPELVLLIFIPIFIYVIAFMWIGEIARKIRVARYVWEKIEPKINNHFPEQVPAISWESYLRENNNNNNRHFKWHHKSTLMIFLGIVISSIGIANYELISNLSDCSHYPFNTGSIVIVNVIELIVFLLVFIRLYNIGKSFK